MSCDMDNDAPYYYCTENGAARCREMGWHVTCTPFTARCAGLSDRGILRRKRDNLQGDTLLSLCRTSYVACEDCDVSHYHKLYFSHLYSKLRYGLHKSEWSDFDNPSGLPTSEEYDNAIKCYLSLYTFDNTSEPFYYRVLTGQCGKRSHKAYHAIALYLERKG